MDRKAICEGLLEKPDIDVLVVGAGINGIGVFRDLARQWVDVLLIDRGDFCSGASSASSHMAHGGIRYLENGEFRLVSEAVNERNRLLVNASHLVRPLPTVVPMFKFFSGLLNAPFKFVGWLDKPSERGAVVIKIGLMFYDALTHGRRIVPKHRFEGRKKTLERYPDLNPEVKYAAMYYDGQLLSPERLAIELVLDAEAEGGHARALSYVSLLGTGPEAGTFVLRDEIGGRDVPVRPHVVVNAAGPWIDPVNARFGLPTRYVAGSKGSHIVVDNPELRRAMGDHEFFFENADGRIVLMLAWYDRVLIGTSDLAIDDADKAVCTEEEIDYFIRFVARIFPSIPVKREQIVFAFSGVRPLPPSTAKNAGQISRDHSLKEDRLGKVPILSLVGGKWTTFRAFGEQATDRTLGILGRKRRQSTECLPIGGGAGLPSDPAGLEGIALRLVHEKGIPFERARTLLERYGTRSFGVAERAAAGAERMLRNLQGYSREEIAFIVAEEKVERLDDLVLRRSTIAWLGRAGRPALEELAEIMGSALGWSETATSMEVDRVAALLRDRHFAHSP